MKIKKRSGKLEEFTLEKIKTSISHTARDINFQITDSDTTAISKKVFKSLVNLGREENYTSSYEVRCLVLETLVEFHFNKVAESFAIN